MSYDLTSYPSIGTALLVSIEIDEYRVNPGDSPTSTVLRFCDQTRTITFGGYPFVGTGQLLNITATRSELRTSTGDLTISLSGIPDNRIKEIINSRIKGNRVQIFRAFYDPATLGSLSIALSDPIGRFFGVINNYSIEEDYDITNRTNSNTLSLICSSWVEVLSKKVQNRKTNPNDMKSFYSTDVSFDRVPSLVGANFDFGAPQ
jgi:hypothetical protein